MTVRSQEMRSNEQPTEPKKVSTPRIGFISVRVVERAFIVLLYAVVIGLVIVSVIGTFYGMRGKEISFKPPWQFAFDVYAALPAFGVAVLVQGVLSITQYGARIMARRDRRWWFLYLATLGVSVYYNYQAYFWPLVALDVPLVIAAILILAGDVLPEFIAVKHE